MIVKRIEKTPVTNEELNEYKEKISKLENEYAVNASDVGMDKRIVTIKFGGEYDELTLVNPTVTETSKEMVVYFEKEIDGKPYGKQKIRKTARHQWFKIDIRFEGRWVHGHSVGVYPVSFRTRKSSPTASIPILWYESPRERMSLCPSSFSRKSILKPLLR